MIKKKYSTSGEEAESAMKCCMIYATAGSPEEAQSLAKALVDEKLVACVNIIHSATSVYRWNGKTESERESILIAKTTIDQRKNAISRLHALHSYETPCIVSYDMADGMPDYLAWVAGETKQN